MVPAGNKILIVDDEHEVCALISQFVQQEGLTPLVAHSGEVAVEKVRTEHPDTMVVDMKLPGMDGMQVLKAAKAVDEDLPVILMTGYPEVRGAVAAIRAGAHDYLAKPLKLHEVLRVVFRALNEFALKRKLRHLSSQLENESTLRESMGTSGAVTRLLSDVTRVAKTNFSVLIQGETGTGKELVADAIYRLSLRCSAPFMAVDCGAIPETLLESELFGHEKGAYTGADKRKIGKFEIAHGGTLFLDEVANLPLGSQAKLLRVLQEKTIYRVGGTQPIGADVRVLAACNKNLHHLGESGSFRSDVYFRLNEFSVWVPPLRERQEDILYLAKRFVDVTNDELQKNVKGFAPSAVDALLAYDWPGNVRQLRSMIRRGVLLADELITEQHLGMDWISGKPAVAASEGAQQIQDTLRGDLTFKEIKQRKIVAMEMELLAQVLRETGGNKAKAARLLHIDYKTIHAKIRRYGILPV